MNESSLVEALKQRDEAALSEVFEQYHNRIYRLAVSILHDEQQADGVVQNTFLALIEHIDRFEERASLGTWLYRVAYNECSGRLRKTHPQEELDGFLDAEMMPTCMMDWGNVPDSILTGEEAMDQMNRAIAQLAPALRVVFTLRDIDELSTRETARIVGISESAVKVRLHRARLALREHLAGYFEEYTGV